MEDRALDADRNVAKPSGSCRVAEQVVGEQGVQVEESVAIETDFVRGADEKLNPILMIEDHLRFEGRAACPLLHPSRSGAWCRAANTCCLRGGSNSRRDR